ncbi:AraC family transcriptional regulator [Phenylobacterium sp.]|uniref:AraC family transcriptional regulator n=1 Tax=Phenylobacterium sp. TaxID=1871053 RepID=UPI0025FF622E|nr:AraC family transcriptional regulator [Phenylobacterium sp.]
MTITKSIDREAAPSRTRPPGSPFLHQKIFAPYKLAVLLDAAADHGVSSDTVLAGAGLDVARVRDPHTRTSISDYIAACENILAASPDPDIAFDAGAKLHLTAYGEYGYALMCSPTMRDFLDFAVRYHLLATPMLRLEWRRDADALIWRFVEIHRDAMSPAARAFLVRQQMMQTATHMRDVSGTRMTPLRALFALPGASRSPRDASRLGCVCLFDQPAHELHYPLSLLDAPLQFGNRLTYAQLEETCDELMGRTGPAPSLVGEIYQRLMREPRASRTMEDIAQELGSSERTLRRRLANENVRYADIADDVRRTLSLRYLQTSGMTADDIAAEVGFSDTANFRRAVKRWTGRTFRQVRREAADS